MAATKEPTFRFKDEYKTSGFVMMPTLVLYDNRLSHMERTLYGVLIRYAGQSEHCFPGIDRLAKGVGCHRRSVYRYLDKLEEIGLIERSKSNGHSNVYLLLDPSVVYCKENLPGQIRDEFVALLRDVGEDCLADKLLKNREGVNGGSKVVSDAPESDTEKEQEEDSEEGSEEDPEEDPVPEKKEERKDGKPVRSFEHMQETLNEARHKHEDVHRKNIQKRKKRKQKMVHSDDPDFEKPKREPSAYDVEHLFRDKCRELFPDKEWLHVSFDGKYRRQAKNLLKRWGWNNTKRCITHVLDNIDQYVYSNGKGQEINFMMFVKLCDVWFPRIIAGKGWSRDNPRDERQISLALQGEYDATITEEEKKQRFL